MKKICKLSCIIAVLIAIISCKSYYAVTFLCEDTTVEMYANDEYIGSNMATYRVPRGMQYVTIRCVENGKDIFTRKYYVKGMKNGLITVNIPADYRYSNGQVYKPTTK